MNGKPHNGYINSFEKLQLVRDQLVQKNETAASDKDKKNRLDGKQFHGFMEEIHDSVKQVTAES